jgi:hypothetical protein
MKSCGGILPQKRRSGQVLGTPKPLCSPEGGTMSNPSSPNRWRDTVNAVIVSLGALVELATKVVKLWQSVHR